MKFTLEIDLTASSVMRTPDDVAEKLLDIGRFFRDYLLPEAFDGPFGCGITDDNGERVGSWRVE